MLLLLLVQDCQSGFNPRQRRMATWADLQHFVFHVDRNVTRLWSRSIAQLSCVGPVCLKDATHAKCTALLSSQVTRLPTVPPTEQPTSKRSRRYQRNAGRARLEMGDEDWTFPTLPSADRHSYRCEFLDKYDRLVYGHSTPFGRLQCEGYHVPTDDRWVTVESCGLVYGLPAQEALREQATRVSVCLLVILCACIIVSKCRRR